MKRFYQIIDTQTKLPVPDTFYEDQAAAKFRRRELNQGLEPPRYIVSPGPDHKRFNPKLWS